MFNLANETLVMEGFNNLSLQIKKIILDETNDMQNITNNFIYLKSKVDQDSIIQSGLIKQIEDLKKEIADYKLFIKDKLTENQKEVRETSKQLIEKLTPPVEIIPKKIEVDYGDERNWGNCIQCEKKQKILNPKFFDGGEGTKRTEGDCEGCGSKLFRIH